MAIRDALTRLLTPQKTKVWHKLALLAATLVLPVTALNWMLLSAYREQISFASKEVQGEAYLKPVRSLAEHLIEHRGLANAAVLGEASARKDLLAKQTEIEEDLKAVANVDQELGSALDTRQKWTEIRNAWPELKRKSLSLTAQQSFEQHTQIIQQVLALFTIVGRSSNLRFDPIPASYYFMDTMTRIPSEADTLGQIRDLAVAAASQKQLGGPERAELLMLIGRYKPAQQALTDDLKTIFSIHARFENDLKTPFTDQLAATDDFLNLVGGKLLAAGSEPIAVAPQELADAGSRAVSAAFRLGNGSAPHLEMLLQGRIDVARTRLIFGFLASAVGVLLTVAIGLLVTKVLTRQVQSIMDVFSQISVGDYQARAEVVSTDELGSMAASLNTMLDNTLVLIQSQTERDAIQQAIVKLLNEVSGVAEGDLTREAQVTDDVTGAIADAFNYMIYQLRRIISDVQDATLQVGTSAGEIHGTTERLVNGSQIQAEQILTTSAAIEEIALSIQQVSENAAESATVAQQALANATQGNLAVQDTIEGMNRIRDQAQETAKRIKRLGESTQEIGQIIQLIDDIADRTSILALNASIQAAAAGEAGRGFAVVAEEVERLAERSTDATKKIATLIKTIQSETNEAVGSMEKSIHEVVEGSKLANQAGKALEDIGTVSNRLAQHIQSISQAAKQQAHGSEAIAKSMTHISDITRESAAGTRQAAESVNVLAALAEALRNSVSTFRLPGRSWQSEGTSPVNGYGHDPNGHEPERNVIRSGSGEFRRIPVRV